MYIVARTGTAQQNVVDTCFSLLRVVNQQTVPVVYANYESGPDDGAGKMSFEAVSLGASSFTISAAGTLWYNSFNPTIPTGGPVTSANDAAANRLYVSKLDQPEHVPLAQYFDIGSRSKAINRIVPLRDALLVFKADGLFRVTSDGAGNVAVSPFDASVKLSASAYRSYGVLNNRVYCQTINGAVAINETSIIPIDDAVSNVFRWGAENSSTANVVVSELDQLVFFYFSTAIGGATSPSQTLNLALKDQVYVFCAKTRAWTEAGGAAALTTSPYTFDGVSINSLPYRWNTSGSIYKDEVTDTNENLATKFYQVGEPPPAMKVLFNISAIDTVAGTVTLTPCDMSMALLRTAVSQASSDATFTVYIKANDGGNEIFKIGAITGAGFNPSDAVIASSPFNTLGSSLVSSFFVTGHVYLWLSTAATVEWLPFSSDAGSPQRLTEVSVLADGAGTLTTANVYAMTEATDSMAGLRTGMAQLAGFTAANTPLPTNTTGLTAMRCPVPATLQSARRFATRVVQGLPGEYMLLSGISYEYRPTGGNSVT
jgi:hypothetical protein